MCSDDPAQLTVDAVAMPKGVTDLVGAVDATVVLLTWRRHYLLHSAVAHALLSLLPLVTLPIVVVVFRVWNHDGPSRTRKDAMVVHHCWYQEI